jgi:hypothetical protein
MSGAATSAERGYAGERFDTFRIPPFGVERDIRFGGRFMPGSVSILSKLDTT